MFLLLSCKYKEIKGDLDMFYPLLQKVFILFIYEICILISYSQLIRSCVLYTIIYAKVTTYKDINISIVDEPISGEKRNTTVSQL